MNSEPCQQQDLVFFYIIEWLKSICDEIGCKIQLILYKKSKNKNKKRKYNKWTRKKNHYSKANMKVFGCTINISVCKNNTEFQIKLRTVKYKIILSQYRFQFAIYKLHFTVQSKLA